MRITKTLTILIAAALGACATTTPPPPESPTPATVVVVAPEPAPFAEIALLPDPPPFTAAAEAELEPLPAPAPDLWERIIAGYAIPDIEGPLVEKWEHWYASRPEYVARMVERSRRYLYHIVNEVTSRGMPAEIALLPMVESAFNPVAMSTSRASGIWQFIPSTGKHYGLNQNFWMDSRRDVLAGTDKALTYLNKLHGDFDDWQLALAGYNWGEGNVGKAIARNKAKGLPTNYQSLSMPAETANYLPKLQAIKNIVRDPEKFGLALADIPDAPYFAVVKTSRKMDTKFAAELAEMSLEEFLALNPQHNRPVIAGADEQTLLLPIDNAEVFAAKLELTNQPTVSWQAYRMRPNETLPQVATKYGMSVETLRALNGIGVRARVPAGHTLLVPSQNASKEAASSLTQAVFTTVPSGRTFYYTAKRGDKLSVVAVRYGVSTQELKAWNGLAKDTLKPGQKLRVTSDVVPVRKAGGSTKRAVATKGAGKQAKSGGKAAAAKPVAGKAKPVAAKSVPGSNTAHAHGNSGS
ncbi:MAG: transglycosylase SLT domain-containing protein [Betaproteobacteria bacterium]